MQGYRSFLSGIAKYRSPFYGLSLLLTTASSFNLVRSILHVSLYGFMAEMARTYEAKVIEPLRAALSFLGINVSHNWVHALIIWCLCASSLARTKSAYRAEWIRNIKTSSDIFNSREFAQKQHGTGAALKSLIWPLQWSDGTLRNYSFWQLIYHGIFLRISRFEYHAPEPLRIGFDLFFFPLSLWAFLREPILSYVDNHNNPEDNWYRFTSSKEIARVNADYEAGRFWVLLRPRQDFRYFFVGQFLTVFVMTLLALLINSALAG